MPVWPDQQRNRYRRLVNKVLILKMIDIGVGHEDSWTGEQVDVVSMVTWTGAKFVSLMYHNASGDYEVELGTEKKEYIWEGKSRSILSSCCS